MDTNQLRLDIDKLAQLTCELKTKSVFTYTTGVTTMEVSDAVANCTKKLYLAKAWVGKLAGYQGVESPYKNDGTRHEVADIEATDAVAEKVESDSYIEKNDVEKIDYLRQEIQALVDLVTKDEESSTSVLLEHTSRINAFNCLCEARFELGFELARIKDVADEVAKVEEMRKGYEAEMAELSK